MSELALVADYLHHRGHITGLPLELPEIQRIVSVHHISLSHEVKETHTFNDCAVDIIDPLSKDLQRVPGDQEIHAAAYELFDTLYIR